MDRESGGCAGDGLCAVGVSMVVTRYFAVLGLAVLLSGVTAPVGAQDLSGFTKILLPAHTSTTIQGASGSTFSTVLGGYTEIDTRVYAVGGNPPAFATQEAFNPLFRVLDYGPARPTGRFLYVETSRVNEVSLQYFLLSSDEKEETADQRTALPIVRDPETGTARILSIPVVPIITRPDGIAGHLEGYRHRVFLRVYDWEGNGTSHVIVRPFVEQLFGDGGALEPVELALDHRGGDDPTFPWYGEIPLDRCLPFSLHTPCVAFTMRIEIDPVDPGLRYFPIVSITDNRTQHVSIFAP